MRRALFVSLLPVVATVASCLAPTAIDLHVKSNLCSKLTKVDIYVDHPEPTTSTQGCSDSAGGEVGHLTILPSGALDANVDIAVVGFIGGANCTRDSTGDKGCIVAKRSIPFSPHETLSLPVDLDALCAGFPCPEGTTCFVENGTPVCKDETCDGDAGGNKCITDAGGPDAAISDVTIEPVPPACPAIAVDAGALTWSWSFDKYGNGAIHEDHENWPQVALAGANQITTAGTTKCGAYLLASTQQNLVNMGYKLENNFTIAIAYHSQKDGEVIGLLGPSGGGFDVKMDLGVIKVSFDGAPVFTDSNKTDGTTWHTFVMTVLSSDAGTGSSVAISIDGAAPFFVPQTLYRAASGPLFVGPIDAVDQLEIYAY